MNAVVRVVVIGAGVMGCATSLALRRRGVEDVVVLERAVPGAEASSAAAGMLAAQIESNDDRERAMFVRARDAYAGWAKELEETTGIGIGYRRSGALEITETEDGIQRLARRVETHRAEGVRAEMLDAAVARALEPELTSHVRGAAWFEDEAQVDPRKLLRALVAAVARAGVTINEGVNVTSLAVTDSCCTGVTLDEREVLGADAVVLAAGSWSSLVRGVPAALPAVRPIRGQLILLEERPPRLAHIVFHRGSYVVPRGDGRVLCGSTMEDVGHRRGVTAAAVRDILASAIRIAPGLGGAEMTRAWCNFRPSAEGGPQIGRSPLPGLFLATGHHRNGILLAKTTADAVADAVLGIAR